MTFFKLFNLLHRRTDYCEMYRIARELAYPEWYEEHPSQRSPYGLAHLITLSEVLMLMSTCRK